MVVGLAGLVKRGGVLGPWRELCKPPTADWSSLALLSAPQFPAYSHSAFCPWHSICLPGISRSSTVSGAIRRRVQRRGRVVARVVVARVVVARVVARVVGARVVGVGRVVGCGVVVARVIGVARVV